MKVDHEKSQLEVNPKKDKLKIIETAAKHIRDDIKAVQTSHRAYPACDELGSDNSINFLPESLKILQGLMTSMTATFWLQYMDMVDILRKFIRAECT